MTQTRESHPVLYYGRCRGGPYNTRQMAHAVPLIRIAIDKDNPRMSYPAQQARTPALPDIMFGSYVWQPALEEWVWDAKSVSDTI